MRPVRLALTVTACLLVVVLAWVAWQVWNVNKSLKAAADDARTLQTAISAGDAPGAENALERLREHAADADDRTGGPTWSALTRLPAVGDDADGIRLVSSVLVELTREGFAQLVDAATDLDAYLPREGRIPLDSIEELRGPVAQADDAFADADDRLSEEDSSGYVGPLRTNFDDLTRRVSDASTALATARKALALLPDMLGAEGPRDYLLIFQNNAEIRATGGLPGAWALVRAEAGEITIQRQGTAADFPNRDAVGPILPLSEEEERVYGPQLGTYFQDANFTPDFPRSAELWGAWWSASFPDTPLDGILSFDPVAMSYLLVGTGPVEVGDVSLSAETVVEELLSRPYLEGDNATQDAFFAEAARSVFVAVTTNLQSPMEFLRGLRRGAAEGRVHLTSFDDDEQTQLAGTALEGALPSGDAGAPHVHVSLNDATGSKMSYYLRYRADVDAGSCSNATQELLGTMSLNQTISAAEAATLPPDVTGGGLHGTQPGLQLVAVRIYGPVGGTIDDVRMDGKRVNAQTIPLDGRPVTVLLVELSGPDNVLITWSMQSGPDQGGDGHVEVTPSVVPGDKSFDFRTAC